MWLFLNQMLKVGIVLVIFYASYIIQRNLKMCKIKQKLYFMGFGRLFVLGIYLLILMQLHIR